MRGCKSPLELTPSNKLRLGARPPRDCGPCGFALHQEAREGGQEAGPGLSALLAMEPGHSLQCLPKSLCHPCPWRLHVWQCKSSRRCGTIYWRKTGLTVPLCTAQLPPVLHGTWRGSSRTPPPCVDCDPLQRYACAGSCCPRENCSCFADSCFHRTRVTLPGV